MEQLTKYCISTACSLVALPEGLPQGMLRPGKTNSQTSKLAFCPANRGLSVRLSEHPRCLVPGEHHGNGDRMGANTASFRYSKATTRSPQSLLVSRQNNPSCLTQPVLPAELFQPLIVSGAPLAPLQQVHVCPVLRTPELDTGLQVGSQTPAPSTTTSSLSPTITEGGCFILLTGEEFSSSLQLCTHLFTPKSSFPAFHLSFKMSHCPANLPRVFRCTKHILAKPSLLPSAITDILDKTVV
nr:uncharacterized protein LOC110363404 [Columba livia]